MHLTLPLCAPCLGTIPTARLYAKYVAQPRELHTRCASCGTETLNRVIVNHPSSGTADIAPLLDAMTAGIIDALQLPHPDERLDAPHDKEGNL